MSDPVAPARGAVAFESDGKGLWLRFSTNAQARYRARWGASVIADAMALATSIDARDVDTVRLRQLFAAGLDHVKGMTEDKAGDLIDGVETGIAPYLVLEAVRASLPAPAAEPADAAGENAGEPEEAAGNGQAEATEPPATS